MDTARQIQCAIVRADMLIVAALPWVRAALLAAWAAAHLIILRRIGR